MKTKLIMNFKKEAHSAGFPFYPFCAVKNEPLLSCRTASKNLPLFDAGGSDISEAVG